MTKRPPNSAVSLVLVLAFVLALALVLVRIVQPLLFVFSVFPRYPPVHQLYHRGRSFANAEAYTGKERSADAS